MRQLLNILCLATLLLAPGCRKPTDQLRQEHAAEELQTWSQRPAKLDGPLTLERAIQLALEHNLGYRISLLQHEIANEARTSAMLGMLPSLDARFQYSHRDKLRIAASKSADTGRLSLEPSYASERDESTFNLELVWGVLDFGISFFRARQEADKALIAEQAARRTRQNLALEVAGAYYRSLVADRAVQATQTLVGKLKSRQAVIQRLVEKKALSPLDGLVAEEEVAMLQIRLQAFQLDLRRAKLQLATLTGLATDAEFTLAGVDFATPPDRQELDVEQLEKEALAQRPELFQDDLRQRISADQVYLQVAALLPSPAGFLGLNTDSNRFLRNKHWVSAGIRASWNLLSLPRRAMDVRRARKTRDLAAQRRLAVAVGVLTQTHLAVLQYEDARTQYELARNLASVRDRKLSETLKSRKQGQLDESKVLEAQVKAFLARIRLMNAHAATKMAEARIANTVGRDPARAPQEAASEEKAAGSEEQEEG